MNIPVLETKRLILRSPTLADAPAYKKNFINYEVIRHLAAQVPWPYPENGIHDFLTQSILPNQGKDRWVWGIFLKDTPGELIGVVDLRQNDESENRGFWLAQKHWGKGIMAEAVIPVMDYAFGDLGFEKMILSNALGNHASRRIKEKTAARYIGTEPAKFVDPQYAVRELWEITKADWAKFRKE